MVMTLDFLVEQQRTALGGAKIKELNQELMNERQKFQSLAKINQDQVSSLVL